MMLLGAEVETLLGIGTILGGYLLALRYDWWRVTRCVDSATSTDSRLSSLLSFAPLTSLGGAAKSMLLEHRVAHELLASKTMTIDDTFSKATTREEVLQLVSEVIEEHLPLAYYGCAIMDSCRSTGSAGLAAVGPVTSCPEVVAKRITEYFNLQLGAGLSGAVALSAHLGTSVASEVVQECQVQQSLIRLIIAYDERAAISSLEQERLLNIAAAAVRALDRVNSLEQSQHRTDAALQEVQEKQRFLSQVSHDMKSPLGVIQSVLGLLAKVPACAEYADLIAGASASANRSRELLEDLLQFATLSAKAVAVHPQWIDPVQIVHDELRRVALIARQQQVKVSYVYPHRESHLIYFDPQALRRILANLISNGLKFAKGKAVKVILSHGAAGQFRLEVQDTGVGISPEGLAKLFQPFSRLHPEIEGTGLGLSICRDLATLSGCTLTVKSIEGVGTTFSLAIPRERYQHAKLKVPIEVEKAGTKHPVRDEALAG